MTAKKIGATNGAVEYADGGLRFFVGPSRIRHYFNSHDEGERRAAILGARSQLGPLPSAITPVVLPPAYLTLSVHGEPFTILIDRVLSYCEARRLACDYLHELRRNE